MHSEGKIFLGTDLALGRRSAGQEEINECLDFPLVGFPELVHPLAKRAEPGVALAGDQPI